MFKKSLLTLLSGFLLWLAMPLSAMAFGLVRDSEIENFLQDLSAPIFKAAGYQRDEIKFFVIGDDSINAFVIGGNRIFIHSGLITKASSPEQVAGVIAHELGHIIAGHVSLGIQDQARLGRVSLATALSSLAIGIAGGDLDVAITASLAGADLSQKTYLKGSRLRETAADEIAIGLLRRAELSPKPLANFISLLKEKETGVTLDEYLQTHPLTKSRLTFLNQEVKKSPFAQVPDRADITVAHRRVKAKIFAHTQSIQDIFNVYNGKSHDDIYAQIIAYHRNHNPQKAFSLLDRLMKLEKDNPYLFELKGEMLAKIGRYPQAIENYRNASNRLKKGGFQVPLIDYQLATATANQIFQNANKRNQLSDADKKILRQAQIYAHRALNQDSNIIGAWQVIAEIYDWLGKEGERDLTRSEYALSYGDYGKARQFALQSKQNLTEGTPSMLRADDILLVIDNKIVDDS